MAINTTVGTDTTTTTLPLSYSMEDPFFTSFDLNKDVVSNPSRLYLQEIVPLGTSIAMSHHANGIYTGSYGSQVILSAYTASSGSNQYGTIQSLLRTYNTTMSSAWIPVSSSDFNRTANYITVLSFSNNVIGDRLSINSSAQGQFSMSLNSVPLYAVAASSVGSYTYDICPDFIIQSSNFAFLFTSSTSTTMNSTNFRGLMFGQLGIIILYNQTGSYGIGNITNPNIIKQERFNSQTYFCRITNQKYNATTNNTWVTYDSTLGYNVIRSSIENPFTVITTIGLYNDNYELLGLAKLSQPILKYADTELHASVVLQY